MRDRTPTELRAEAIHLILEEIISKRLTAEEWERLFYVDGKCDWNNCQEMVIRIRPNKIRCYVEAQLPDFVVTKPQG